MRSADERTMPVTEPTPSNLCPIPYLRRATRIIVQIGAFCESDE